MKTLWKQGSNERVFSIFGATRYESLTQIITISTHELLKCVHGVEEVFNNSSRSSDATRLQRSESTSPQEMAYLSDDTKPFPETMLTYHQRVYGTYLRPISLLRISIRKNEFENTLLKLYVHLLKANELKCIHSTIVSDKQSFRQFCADLWTYNHREI